jgi:hypothetical protein
MEMKDAYQTQSYLDQNDMATDENALERNTVSTLTSPIQLLLFCIMTTMVN